MEGVILRNNSLDKKLDLAEKSVKLYKFYVRNQGKRLEELYKKMATVQNTIDSNSITSEELEKLIRVYDKILISVKLHKVVISELQKGLNTNSNNLHQLKSQQR